MLIAPLRRALASSALVLALVAIAGCGVFGGGKDEEKFAKDSPEQIYRDARKDLRTELARIIDYCEH